MARLTNDTRPSKWSPTRQKSPARDPPVGSRTGAPPEGPSSCPCAFRPKLSLRVLPHSSTPAIPSGARLRMRVLPLPPLVHLGLGSQRGSASRGRKPPGHPLRRQALPQFREVNFRERGRGGAGPGGAGVERTPLCVKTRQLGGLMDRYPLAGGITKHSGRITKHNEPKANESDTAP